MATANDPRVEQLLRRREARPDKCVHCNGRLNSFDKSRCPHCRLDQPVSADVVPVTRRVEPQIPPKEAPLSKPVIEIAPHSSNGTAEKGPALCKDCGKPLRGNGCCYNCRPRRSPTTRPTKLVAGDDFPIDPEVLAIGRILAALADLDSEQTARVLGYVRERTAS